MDLHSPRLHIVTGKGGTGKTTAAAALALAFALDGKRVLVAEVEERQGLAQVFDCAPLSPTETRILGTAAGGEVHGLAVDPKAALLEYLQLFYKLGRAGGLLERFGAIDFATTIAPGVRDLLTIGKIYEAARRRVDGRHGGNSPVMWDAIVLDAPPTGRIGRFLNVGREVADLARVGPIRSQADSIMEMLRSPHTAVHLVTLLEEMPVQETSEAVSELRGIGLNIGAVIANMVRAELFTDAALEQAEAGRLHMSSIRPQLEAVGVKVTDALVEGLVEQAREHAERVALEREQYAVLHEMDETIVELPALPGGVDGNGLRALADDLAEQGFARGATR